MKKGKKGGNRVYTAKLADRVADKRACMINRKEMAREDIVPTFKRFSNRVIIFFFSFF